MGLRVVQDVVYNHLVASALDKLSVLDKAVPGYYLRRMEDGSVCNSACCNNTATEHRMMERLMIDDLVHWATAYRIDGFRFDIMGHIMVSSMERARAALDALTVECDGVDGRSICIYGEAWDFGEVMGNQRGRNASQLNITGTGLGGFNDRLRDAALGGSPFAPPQLQGFLTGLHTDPNPHMGPPTAETYRELLHGADLVRLSMAGNLQDFKFETGGGEVRSGRQISFLGLPAAYCAHPSENVVYLGCHDNETLYDNVVLKANHKGEGAVCARIVQLALGITALSQGIAFFHAGDDLLRSKSLDRDSYNSGDWFNALRWDKSSNNFGVGLPPANKNSDTWPLKKQLLGMPGLKASTALIEETHDWFCRVLRLRYSSPLFRLRSATAVISQVACDLNVGPTQSLGVVAVSLRSAGDAVDPQFESLYILINATSDQVSLDYPQGAHQLVLHPALEGAALLDRVCFNDEERRLMLPARTMIVAGQRH